MQWSDILNHWPTIVTGLTGLAATIGVDILQASRRGVTSSISRIVKASSRQFLRYRATQDELRELEALRRAMVGRDRIDQINQDTILRQQEALDALVDVVRGSVGTSSTPSTNSPSSDPPTNSPSAARKSRQQSQRRSGSRKSTTSGQSNTNKAR